MQTITAGAFICLEHKEHIFERLFCWKIHCLKSVRIRSFFWSVFSWNTVKYGTEKTPYLDTFHAMIFSKNVSNILKIQFNVSSVMWCFSCLIWTKKLLSFSAIDFLSEISSLLTLMKYCGFSIYRISWFSTYSWYHFCIF